MGLSLTTPPAEEPVELFRLKEHLRVHPDVKGDDGLIYEMAQAAREMVEGGWGLQLVTATWRYTLDRFPAAGGPIELPRAPLISVASLKYTAPGGTLTTVDPSEYEVVTAGVAGLLRPAYGESWPDARPHPDSVEVVFTAGFGTAPEVPAALKLAIKAAALEWYEGRSQAGVLPPGAKALVRRWWGGRLFA